MRWLVVFGFATLLAGAPPSFQRDIRPLLVAKCVMCHSERSPSGSVDLSTYASIAKHLSPKAPELSPLFQVIDGPQPRMPKVGGPLDAGERAMLRSWIAAGAPDDSRPGDAPALWWSQRPLKNTKPPSPGHPVDAFWAAKLREKGLSPSTEADRRTLIRRLTYNLHGLAPTPDEVQRFVNDRSPGAYERLVDRLLASPRYGERWARHWLDVVHYGDSHGYDKDKPRPHAWRYRDWVIRAFNSDMPYARFVAEQIAGDVLAPDDADSITATGFLVAGPWDFVGHQELREGTSDKNLTRVLDRDDIVATVMSTFQSQTVHCARCHDHKFDPIAQADYYSLQAVFAGIDRADRPVDRDPRVAAERRALWEQKRQTLLALRPLNDRAENASTPELDQLDHRIRDASLLLAHLGQAKTPAEQAEKDRLTAQRAADTAARRQALNQFLGAEHLARVEQLEADLAQWNARLKALPPPDYVYAPTSVFDRQGTFRPALSPRPVFVLARGSVDAPLAPAPPGTLGERFALADPEDEGQRRVALARSLTQSSNAFTWRSIVNRVWQYHFGVGIVDSANDFGRMGSEPTHPELLDWLAVWFRDEARGSLKQLHRLLLTSAAYRQSSAHREDTARIDADNRFLWRMNRQRLDAEAVRDTLVQLSGKMDLSMGGPAVRHFYFKDDHSPVYDYARYDPLDPGLYRRSIYRFLVRSVPDPFMERLDCPDPSLLTPKRNVTLTAVQALTLLNNPFVLRMSQEMASRLAPGDPVASAFQEALGRAPTPDEHQVLREHAAQFGLPSALRLLFNTNEFVFVD